MDRAAGTEWGYPETAGRSPFWGKGLGFSLRTEFSDVLSLRADSSDRILDWPAIPISPETVGTGGIGGRGQFVFACDGLPVRSPRQFHVELREAMFPYFSLNVNSISH